MQGMSRTFKGWIRSSSECCRCLPLTAVQGTLGNCYHQLLKTRFTWLWDECLDGFEERAATYGATCRLVEAQRCDLALIGTVCTHLCFTTMIVGLIY